MFSTELIVERTLALGMQGKVTVSHGYGLGAVSESVTARVIESLAAADIAMTTVAPSSRTALSIVDLTGAGVRVDTHGYAGYRTSARVDSLLAKLIVTKGAVTVAYWNRAPGEVANLIRQLGYEPVWKDWDAALTA